MKHLPQTYRPTPAPRFGVLRRFVDQPIRIARRVHRDEQGAEGLEKLLIIAAVVLPLLGLLIFFRNEMGEWVSDLWEEVKNDGQDFNTGDGTGGV